MLSSDLNHPRRAQPGPRQEASSSSFGFCKERGEEKQCPLPAPQTASSASPTHIGTVGGHGCPGGADSQLPHLVMDSQTVGSRGQGPGTWRAEGKKCQRAPPPPGDLPAYILRSPSSAMMGRDGPQSAPASLIRCKLSPAWGLPAQQGQKRRIKEDLETRPPAERLDEINIQRAG